VKVKLHEQGNNFTTTAPVQQALLAKA